MNVLDEKISAIEKVHQAFAGIMQHERCRTCSCLHTDTMTTILDAIQEVEGSENVDDSLAAAKRDFSQWIEDAGKVDLHQ